MKKNIVFALALLFSHPYTLSKIPWKTAGVMWGGVAALIGFYTLQDYVRIKQARKNPDEYYKKLCPYTYEHERNQQKEGNKVENKQACRV